MPLDRVVREKAMESREGKVKGYVGLGRRGMVGGEGEGGNGERIKGRKSSALKRRRELEWRGRVND
jgi:hypothetical protein